MIWSIGDLHFDITKNKSMDIFGENWKDHEEKIIDFWKENVCEDDLVIVAGDISWALKLEESMEDLMRIDNLPGVKCFIKGNHDYWWSTKSKLSKMNLKSIHFIYNDSFVYKDYIICGTRGWTPLDSENITEDDKKIYLRELNRLKTSLEFHENTDKKIIAALHYPPFNSRGNPNDFLDLLNNYNVKICVYGHLHGDGHDYIKEGNYNGTDVLCVSSDYIDFKLLKLI